MTLSYTIHLRGSTNQVGVTYITSVPMVNNSGSDSGALSICFLCVCVPCVLCSLRSFFHEAAGGSINLVGYLAVDLLGENGDNIAAFEVLHS